MLIYSFRHVHSLNRCLIITFQFKDKLGKYEVENGRLRMENQNLQKKLNNLKELANAVNAE